MSISASKHVTEPERIQPASLETAALLAASTAALAACGGGGDGGSGSSAATAPVVSNPVTVAPNAIYLKAASNEEASRFLQKALFSASDADITALRNTAYAQFLQQQFDAPIGQTGQQWLEARGYGESDSNNYFFTTYPATFMVWNQLFTAQDPMRKRCALALSEYFVVSMNGVEFTWRSHGVAQYWDTLVSGAFGNFRQLLEQITLNPAMGYYLNTKGNQKEDPAKGRLPDENYSREVMQLFTIGLSMLNPDGTEKRDGNGNKIDSYTAADVAGLAKVFTGYDFDTSDGVRITPVGVSYTIESKAFTTKPMALNAAKHSTSSTSFLGTTIAAGTSGEPALKTALDTLFNHPNVAPFFSKQMIQRLVTSNPSPAYVARVAAKFIDNGKAVRGDLKAVWAAILLDDEALAPQGLSSNTFGKLREPMLRFIQWGRTFGLSSAAGSWKIFDLSNVANQLGQSPLYAPSVFNFFRPGFVPPNTALASTQSPAPEFQLVNESTVGGYLNYMQDVIRNGINCPEPSVPQAAYTNYSRDIQPKYAAELALVQDAAALVARLNLLLCAGQLSSSTQTLIVNALNATPVIATTTDAKKLDRVAAAVLMVMASSDYLVQK
jgi:uncharacterized protein (DUF1800 family)